MKKILIVLFLTIGLAASISAQEIKWLESYDEALEKAEAENKNILVLITAPSWCEPCKYLEEFVWPNSDVIKLVSEKYIALLVLDVVNGGRNPELTKFSFTGYPTTFVFNTKKEKLAEIVGAQYPEEMVRKLKVYTDPDFDVASTFGNVVFEEGTLKQISLTQWELIENGEKSILQEVSRGVFSYLYDGINELHLAVPLTEEETEIFISRDSGTTWDVWYEVQ